ncbi:expressed unknown protein [Seminavis robusta]|uniref:Uncharacterized protein n=1 Tax=Seminavis robusta TaxID=568900 RepID=A0A9N8EYA3_9STRA|nr:expressed unknown protein [Seminavis robusta]|eukprot:Sro2162_g317220.1 n/a (226) ;mRNA; f:17019-17696
MEYVTLNLNMLQKRQSPPSSKDVIIDVPAEPVEDRTSNRYTKKAPDRERYASKARAAANTGGYQKRPARSGRERNEYRTPQGGSDAPANKQNHKPSSVRNPAVSSSLFRLPPAKSTGTQGREGNSASKTRRRRRTSSANDGSRRVYSPYDENDPSSQVYRDAIDRFGEFFVSATDTILWAMKTTTRLPTRRIRPLPPSPAKVARLELAESNLQTGGIEWKKDLIP